MFVIVKLNYPINAITILHNVMTIDRYVKMIRYCYDRGGGAVGHSRVHSNLANNFESLV